MSSTAAPPLFPRARRIRRLAFRVASVLLILLVVLFVGVLSRTLAFRSRQVRFPASTIQVDRNAMAEHLAQAIRFRTISFQVPAHHYDAQFAGLHEFFRRTYPRMHAALDREVVNRWSLLYTWKGRDPSLPPVLLLAHQDVVPIGDASAWKHEPFSGDIADGAVWGRGARDDKGSLVAIFEAVEQLLREGYEPYRTVVLAFGHDEEVGGRQGAVAIAALLASRGVRPLYVLDEGGGISTGVITAVPGPVAAVGIAEKGYVTLELTVSAAGGHSSMPPAQTAVGVLAAAIHRLEDDPFPARVDGVTRQMLEYLAPAMPFSRRMAIANLWLAEPLVRHQLLQKPSSAASIHTTTAPTMLRGGVQENVLPQQVQATVNFRILPGESIAGVVGRVRKVVADDRVQIMVAGNFASEPSPVSPTDSPGFHILQQTVAQVAPDATFAPYLTLGGTDSRHYTGLTPAVFRFSASRIDAAELPTIHGNNERQSLENCELLVKFYVQLLRNSM